MTARCPSNGTSSLKPGAGQSVVVGAGLITAGIEALAPEFLPVAALVDGFTYAALSQCGSDPPPMPTWDLNDATTIAIGMLNPNWQQTVTKLNNLLLNYSWDLWCQCDGGGATPSQPTGGAPNVTIVTGAPSQPCFQGSLNSTPSNCIGQTQYLSVNQDVTTALLPTTGTNLSITDGGGTFQVHGVPSGVTRYEWTYTLPSWSASTTFSQASVQISFWDSAGNQTGNDHFTNNFPANARTASFHTLLPANTAYYRATFFCNTVNTVGTATSPDILKTQVFCGGNPPGAFNSCCPPDPAIMLALNNILTLLQHPAAGSPQYKKGNVHANLTGSGSLTVAGVFGVLADITQGVPTSPQLPGNPPYQWNVGWMSILTGDGMIDEKRLTRQHQVWASALAPYATTIGYFIEPGFTVTLTELLPA